MSLVTPASAASPSAGGWVFYAGSSGLTPDGDYPKGWGESIQWPYMNLMGRLGRLASVTGGPQLTTTQCCGAGVTEDGQLVMWGTSADKNYWKAVPVEGTPKFQKISGNSDFSSSGFCVILGEDGNLYGWGESYYGANGAILTYLDQPTKIEGISDVIDVSCGSDHTVVLKRDGTVWAFGTNNQGQLGNPAIGTGYYATPSQVPGLKNIVSIAAGGACSLALSSDGHVYAWGAGYGLGVATNPNTWRWSPELLTGLSNVAQISTSGAHGMAVQNDGSVVAWGYNDYGQLGLPAVSNTYTPPTTIPWIWDARKSATAGQQSYIILRDGTAVQFGMNLPDMYISGTEPHYISFIDSIEDIYATGNGAYVVANPVRPIWTETVPFVAANRMESPVIKIHLAGNPATSPIPLLLQSTRPGIASVPASATIATGTNEVDVPISLATLNESQVDVQFYVTDGTTRPWTQVEVSSPYLFLDTVPNFIPLEHADLPLTTNFPAPAGGLTVSITSSDPKMLHVPAIVVIPAGERSVTVPADSGLPVFTTQVDVTAKAAGLTTTTRYTVQPNAVWSADITPTTQVGGKAVSVTLNLQYASPKGGMYLYLSTPSQFISMAPVVAVPEGATSVTTLVRTYPVSMATSESLAVRTNPQGDPFWTAIQLRPPYLAIATVDSAVVGGLNLTAKLALETPGLQEVVNMASSNPSIVAVPVTVTIPAGASSAYLALSTTAVVVPTNVAIRFEHRGRVLTSYVTVNPSKITSVSLSPTTVKGGDSSVVSFSFDGPTPAGGYSLQMVTSDPSAKITSPILIPAGKTGGSARLYTKAVTATKTVTLSITCNGITKSSILTITP